MRTVDEIIYDWADSISGEDHEGVPPGTAGEWGIAEVLCDIRDLLRPISECATRIIEWDGAILNYMDKVKEKK